MLRLLPNTRWSRLLFALHAGPIQPAAWAVDSAVVRSVHAGIHALASALRTDRRALEPYLHRASRRAR